MFPYPIKVKDYNCFKNELQGFERILPINIIVGKNNSGKSSLIDMIQNVCKPNVDFPNIYSDINLSFRDYETIIYNYSSNLASHIELKQSYDIEVKNQKFIYILEKKSAKSLFKYSDAENPSPLFLNTLGINLVSLLKQNNDMFLFDRKFRRLNAERNISPEGSSYDIFINSNGEGTTNTVFQLLSRSDLQKHKLVNDLFLKALNSIVMPEIEFKDIITQHNKNGIWEIFFEDCFNNNIPLSKMGSGIKTVILTLANLLLIPAIEESKVDEYVFAFEELENNLHPSLQRKLYQFIKKFSKDNTCTFFITTHSNIGIDIFYNYQDAQLISVNNENGVSTCKTIIQNDHINDVLNQLGFRASDLLQTNGIIWVEGPSDRIYINKWISLLDNTLAEGVHYSIMFYGGKLLSHITFDQNKGIDELISLLKINKNAYVVIDKDAKKITDKINKTKERVQKEIGEGKCWVTSGREIENYLTISTLIQWLNSKKKEYANTFSLDKYKKIEDQLPIEPLYNRNKNGYAKEIVDYIKAEDLDYLDLKSKINSIVESIRKWN